MFLLSSIIYDKTSRCSDSECSNFNWWQQSLMARSTIVTMFYHKMSSNQIQSYEERKTAAVKF